MASRPSARFRGTQAATARAQNVAEAQRRANLAREAREEEEKDKAKRRRTTIIVIVVAVILLLILGAVAAYFLFFRNRPTTGTGGTGGGGTGGGTGQPIGGACTTASQCGTAGAICSANICKNPPGSSCTSASTCPDKYNCISGVCEGILQGVCSLDSDCQEPLECINLRCGKKTCTSQTDCQNGGICNQPSNPQPNCLGLLNDFCQVDDDCASPYICSGGANSKCIEQFNCTATPNNCERPGTSCITSASPSKCVLALDAGCVENEQCDALGYRALCHNTQCKAYGGDACPTDPSSCLRGSCAGIGCNPAAPDCFINVCTCETDAQCAPDQKFKLCGLSTLPNRCVECRTDADCTDLSKPICDDFSPSGRCTKACTTNADCTDPALPTCYPGLWCAV